MNVKNVLETALNAMMINHVNSVMKITYNSIINVLKLISVPRIVGFAMIKEFVKSALINLPF